MRRLRAGISRIDGARALPRLWAWTCSSARAASPGPTRSRSAAGRSRFRRAVIATGARAGGAADPGLDRGRLPDQRDRVHADRAAARGSRSSARARSAASWPRRSPASARAVTLVDEGAAHPAARGRRRGRRSSSARWSATACGSCSSRRRGRASKRGDGERRSPRPGRADAPRRSPATSCSWPPGARPNVEGLGLEAAGVAYRPGRRRRGRPPAHEQPAHLRRRRHLLARTSSPTSPTRTARHRGAERAVLRARRRQGQQPGDAVGAPIPTPRWRTSA